MNIKQTKHHTKENRKEDKNYLHKNNFQQYMRNEITYPWRSDEEEEEKIL